MMGAHFSKKFGKRPPPGIIVTTVNNFTFVEKIETFGTAIPNKTRAYNVEKYQVLSPIEFNKKVILFAKEVKSQANQYRKQLFKCQKRLNRNKYIIF